MGKKPRSGKGKERAQSRKLDKSTLPPPPADVANEIGSAKLLTDAKVPGSGFKALGQDGYDDGGVADLTLVIDLEDAVLRRKRGENNYFTALKADLLPRVTNGHFAGVNRRDQKIRLAKLLFSEDDDEDEDGSEVYVETDPDEEGSDAFKKKKSLLDSAKYALHLSTVLREPACASLSLSEISKRYLFCYGKGKMEEALRCADKAIEIASDGFYDSDDIAVEANDEPKIDEKHEKNATYPGLSNPAMLKLQSARVSHLCLRSAYLHRGNALSAMDKNDAARESYEKVFPMLENEPRCGRLDWERCSLYINIGNTYSRGEDFASASKYYDLAEKLGNDHLAVPAPEGNHVDGTGLVVASKRARAFALKKAGKDEEGKKEMKLVLELQMKWDKLQAEQKEKNKAAEAEAAAQEAS